MDKKKLIFIALAAVVLIGGALWCVKIKRSVVLQPAPDYFNNAGIEKKQLSQATCDMKDSGAEVSKDWKVYQNQSPRFSFKYPSKWDEKTEKTADGEITISLHNPEKKCYAEGSPALCGVRVILVPIKENESANLKYLNFFEEVSKTEAVEIKNVCVDGKEATEITDYQRHEIIFDRNGYSFKILSENLGSESDNKEFWNVVDQIGLGLHF